MAQPPALDILFRYAAGYFPLYDLSGRFYWERFPLRAVIPLHSETLARARRIVARSRKRFTLRYSASLDPILALLQHPGVKPNSWVRSHVIAIYRSLESAGLLQTIEAFDDHHRLAGAVLGLVLPGTFIAETMFSLQSDASKICLCRLIEDAYEAGHQLIDVQTPHDNRDFFTDAAPLLDSDKTPHPCIRLGEQTLPVVVFLCRFQSAFKSTFSGTLQDWLQISTTLARARAAGKPAPPLPSHPLAAAMLQHNYPQPPQPPPQPST